MVGWVTTKLLKPHPGPAQPPEPSSDKVGLLTVAETPSPQARDQTSKVQKSHRMASRNEEEEEDDENADFDCGDGPVHKVMDKLTDFMAQTTYLIKEACEEDLLLIVSLHTQSPVSMEEAEGIIDSGVWRQVEAEVSILIDFMV